MRSDEAVWPQLPLLDAIWLESVGWYNKPLLFIFTDLTGSVIISWNSWWAGTKPVANVGLVLVGLYSKSSPVFHLYWRFIAAARFNLTLHAMLNLGLKRLEWPEKAVCIFSPILMASTNWVLKKLVDLCVAKLQISIDTARKFPPQPSLIQLKVRVDLWQTWLQSGSSSQDANPRFNIVRIVTRYHVHVGPQILFHGDCDVSRIWCIRSVRLAYDILSYRFCGGHALK